MEKKMTRVDALNIAMEVVTDAEALEVLGKIKASIEKKNSSPKSHKVTDAQKWLRAEIIRILSDADAPMSVAEIGKLLDLSIAPDNAKYSTAAITANIGTMLINGKVENPNGCIVRSVDGKTAKFAMTNSADAE